MTGDERLARHDARLDALGARRSTRSQVDVRVHVGDRDPSPPFLPPEPNTWVRWDRREVLWLGPDEWLVVEGEPGDAGTLFADLETLLAGSHHSVVDVSASRATIELTRADRSELLAHGCGLDLHPRGWREGMCAQTLLARVPVLLQEGAAATTVYVRPSYLPYLVDWLVDAADERS